MDTVKRKGEPISQDQRSTISLRYKHITKAINIEFWDSMSETDHSFYVGSYGRNTAIDTSDIDILVELPKDITNVLMLIRVMDNLDYFKQ